MAKSDVEKLLVEEKEVELKPTEIVSNQRTLYPMSSEREYARVSRAYIKILDEAIKNNFPALMEAYKREQRNDSRYDGWVDLRRELDRIIMDMYKEIEVKTEKYNLKKAVEKIANGVKTSSQKQWAKTIKKVFGVDVQKDYYKGDKYKDLIDKWVDENVNRIKTIPNNTLGEMKEVILKGFRDGRSAGIIRDQIEKTYKVTRRKAELLARDQLGSLNAQIEKEQQTRAGVKKYRWTTAGDERVRDCHRSFNKKIFSWDDPPEIWYRTNHGIVHTGRHCHPAQDYNCRCVAISVWDTESIDALIKGI